MGPVVMVIAPHPDDAELGMGGTIAALIKQNAEVVVVDLTDGEPTPFGSPEIRAKETDAASKVLGVKTRLMLGIKNREIFDTPQNRKLVAEVIRQFRPEILFVPYWEDAHPDHVHASQLCEAARFSSKFVKGDYAHQPHYPRKILYYFSTHMRVRFNPSFVYDISDFLNAKLEAVACYNSQFAQNPNNSGVFERLRTEAAHWGLQTGTAYGEPFVCRENIKLDSIESLKRI